MTASPLELPVRQGRNVLAFVILLPLAVLALYAGYEQRDMLGPGHWWVLVFPLLLGATVYRLWRRRVPLALDSDGVRARTGMTLLGLRTEVPWRAVRRIRVTAAGLLLIELKDGESWGADKPWLVRANLRANHRKTGAEIVQPLRELAGSPEEITKRVIAMSPVRVEAPDALRGRG